MRTRRGQPSPPLTSLYFNYLKQLSVHLLGLARAIVNDEIVNAEEAKDFRREINNLNSFASNSSVDISEQCRSLCLALLAPQDTIDIIIPATSRLKSLSTGWALFRHRFVSFR